MPSERAWAEAVAELTARMLAQGWDDCRLVAHDPVLWRGQYTTLACQRNPPLPESVDLELWQVGDGFLYQARFCPGDEVWPPDPYLSSAEVAARLRGGVEAEDGCRYFTSRGQKVRRI